MKDVDMLAPIMIDGEICYVTMIRIGSCRRTLLSSEVQFLRTTSRLVGVRLQQIAIEAASRQQVIRESILRQQLAEAELRALRAQINPHFLFNSLNTIAELALSDPGKAERMILHLASIFRHVLEQTDRQFITLGEEFDFIRHYLTIEQERFGERLKVVFHIDPDLGGGLVPTLMLQPLVENALKHGLSKKISGGTLYLSAIRQGEQIEVSVADNGRGFPTQRLNAGVEAVQASEYGVGLSNTISRLHATFGGRATLSIDSAPDLGCKVSIQYPLKGAAYAMPGY
jgi:two-component system LytT family sensor kinase